MRVSRPALLTVLFLLAATAVAAQQPRAYTPPRTADGQPDLQGVWINPTITPFERPANLGEKAFLTPQEAADIEKRTLERRAAAEKSSRPGDVGNYNDFWMDSGTTVLATRQTSLVVDPPDGRVPVRPEAEAIRDGHEARITESFEHMSVWDRCITRGIPGAMFPAGYNNAYQIVQTPGYVMIFHEMIHDARIIPIDGRPHVPSPVRLWNGDPRGRWDGNTLVVETTNFNGKGWIATNAAAGRIKGIPQSDAARIVERFTRTAANQIGYEVTIEDPKAYTRPWTVSIPLTRDDDYRIFEYACHEGNQAVGNILRGGRAADTHK
jgi:hypothetical protein